MHLSGKPPLKQGIPIKAVEDDHVDRPRVEAPQCAKPIGTNSLIVLFFVRMYNLHTNGRKIERTLQTSKTVALLEPVVIAKEKHAIPSRTRL